MLHIFRACIPIDYRKKYVKNAAPLLTLHFIIFHSFSISSVKPAVWCFGGQHIKNVCWLPFQFPFAPP
jgi:hypothetical protein